jgi:hypothetical protein
VGQSHRRPARPALTVHRGYAANAARNAGASVHALISEPIFGLVRFQAPVVVTERPTRTPVVNGTDRATRAPIVVTQRPTRVLPTRSALRALPTTPWPPQRPPSRRTAASLLSCWRDSLCSRSASCRHREAHSRRRDASAACSRHDSLTTVARPAATTAATGMNAPPSRNQRGGLEAAGGGEQLQRKQRRCATRHSARRVERQ